MKPIQKVALRITGKNPAFQKVIHIWDRFEAKPAQGEVDISLLDVIEASQVGLMVDDPMANLSLADQTFPVSEMIVEIIDEMHPNEPLSSRIPIQIQNTPWQQVASLARRNGSVFIDYYLKNLGSDGDFDYILNLTKIIDDVGVSDHPVWNGTGLIFTRSNSEKITLKRGESKLISIPIPTGDLQKGRYVAEIFTKKEQPRVQFDFSG